MKYIISFLLLANLCFGQVVSIRHNYYVANYDVQKHYPIKVTWWLTKEMITCAKPFPRADRFSPDHLLTTETDLDRYFINSGFDRGHMMPAEDNRCSGRGMAESFYFTNVAPQHPSLNRGPWKDLEEHIRYIVSKVDSVKVICGSYGNYGVIRNTVTIPSYCWKVFYIKSTNEVKAYLFPNNETAVNSYISYEVSLQELELKTGLHFNF